MILVEASKMVAGTAAHLLDSEHFTYEPFKPSGDGFWVAYTNKSKNSMHIGPYFWEDQKGWVHIMLPEFTHFGGTCDHFYLIQLIFWKQAGARKTLLCFSTMQRPIHSSWNPFINVSILCVFIRFSN